MLNLAKGANLLLMFLLELGVLFSVGYWGWTLDAPLPLRLAAAVGAVALFVGVWAVFGAAANARIPLRGPSRAVLEVLWFGGGAVALAFAGAVTAALVFAALFAVNAALRFLWQEGSEEAPR
ncbi:YrdB family protein [Nocardiopsis sp. LOL_012]|uniref:YrdB family protein n=1 Tax=Nocardiopsis sp. LOL_012 TaxID=3345409 RepID=UPI003A8707B7